jgi:hypothetical protein
MPRLSILEMKETYTETGVFLIDTDRTGDFATALGLKGGMRYSFEAED